MKYDNASLKALRLQEKAEEAYVNCDDCDGYGAPEQCERCSPLFDRARVARRAALTSKASDGPHLAGGMQTSATEGAITQSPAHPMATIAGGPIGPSGDDVLDALQWLYSVCSVEDDSKYAAVTNAARVISEALERRALAVTSQDRA